VGGHAGLVGETGVNLKGFMAQSGGKPIMYSFGPRATFADANYNNAFFGINQTQSTNSGLAGYDAKAGRGPKECGSPGASDSFSM
jgi:MipA family protein